MPARIILGRFFNPFRTRVPNIFAPGLISNLRGIFKKKFYARREFMSTRRLRLMSARREFESSCHERVKHFGAGFEPLVPN